jgi:hypothetical protein
VKWTISFTARPVAAKVGCDTTSDAFGAGANSVCQAEDGDYLNFVSSGVDIFSPGTMPGLGASGDGAFLVFVGSSFRWGQPSQTEPFQFQLTGPKFRPVDTAAEQVTTGQSAEVTANAGALKIFMPEALALELYGADFNPVLTRKDELNGLEVASQLTEADGLAISRSADGFLFELPSHPFSAPVFAISSDPSAPAASAPSSNSGPLILSVSPRSVATGGNVSVSGARLSGVTSVTIDGQQVAISNLTASGFDLLIPSGLQPGVKDLVVVSSHGRMTIQAALTIVAGADASENLSASTRGWTKRISDSSVKIYAKDVIGAGKVQFFVNGLEIAWIRAENDRNEKLRGANNTHYLVRTARLIEGVKNVFEIHVDGVRIWRTAYTG